MSGATSAVGVAGLGAQLLGGLLGAKGAYDSANAQRDAYAIKAAIARQNAQIAEQQAQVALQNGQVAEQTSRLRTAQTFGAQRAALAANGVDLGEGNANEILSSTAFMGERYALTIEDNAARQAWGYRIQGVNATNEDMLYSRAESAINPELSATTSLLGTAGHVASGWYNLFGKS